MTGSQILSPTDRAGVSTCGSYGDRLRMGTAMTPPTLCKGAATARAVDGVDTLTFDSDILPPAERFERYRDFYAIGADTVQTGPDFLARVDAFRLDRANLYDRRVNDIGHVRRPDRIAQDGFDHLTMTLVLSGRYEVDSGHGYRMIPPGCAVILDTLEPMQTRARDVHIVTISIGRTQFVAAIGVADGMHGHFVGAGDAALMIDFIQALLRRLPAMSRSMVVPATHALLTLMAAAIGAGARATEPSATAIRDALRIARVRALVDANIADPDFGADTVIAQGGVARATLYRAFRSQGGIAGYIRSRRLEGLRMTLGDTADPRSFAQMAADLGLKSEAHASRLFLERFGARPGEYRAAAAARPLRDDPVRKMVQWQEHLRDVPPSTHATSHA